MSLGDEIKLLSGGYTLIIGAGLAKASIYASSPRAKGYDKYLAYILYAANDETRAARFRSGRGLVDDSDLPACN